MKEKTNEIIVGVDASTVYAESVTKNVGAGDSARPFLKRNTQKGITLIALIISIIIMLILAVVSINIIQNQEIITKSQKAVDKHQKEGEKEAINIGYSEYLIKKYNGKSNPTLTVAGAEVSEPTDDEWIITFTKTGNVYTLSADGKTIAQEWTDNGDGTFTKGETTLSIGDYVGYNEAGTETYTADTSKGLGRSGKWNSTNKKYDLTAGEVYTTEDLGWRVLGVNNKGELELISDNPMSEDQKVCLANEEGYLYGAYELNTMCKTLYGNGIGSTGKAVASGARSLNVDDIDKLAGITTEEQKKSVYSRYGSLWQYQFPSGGTYLQYRTSTDNGETWTDWANISDTKSVYQKFRMPGADTSTTIRVDKPGISETLKYTSYGYAISSYVKQTTSEGKNMADIITKGTGSEYIDQYLASTYVRCISDRVAFGMHGVFGGNVSSSGNVIYASLYYSYDDSNYYYCRVRPVVSLKSDIQIEKTEINDGSTLAKACIIK